MRFSVHSLSSVALFCLLLVGCTDSIREEPWEKPVIITTSFAPNYLWHLLATAEISYASDYSDRFRHTIDPADLEFLRHNKQYLAFGSHGRTGPFTFLLVFLPSYLELETTKEFEEYFVLLNSGFKDFDFSAFFDHYSEARWDDPFIAMNSGIFDPPVEYRGKIKQQLPMFWRFIDVVINNLDAYRDEVWEEAKNGMQQRINELSAKFIETDYIRMWEEQLNAEFDADRYKIILCYASKNGPDANSLSYDKNVFYYDSPLERIVHFISHEIGTHILSRCFELIDVGEYDQAEFYAAYEVLSMFYNKMVLGHDDLEYRLGQFHDEHYLAVFAQHYRKGISPAELLTLSLRHEE